MYSDPKKVFCISFRYIVILYPFRTRMQMKPCCFLIGVINLLSMAFTAPYVYIMESVRDQELGTAQCQVSGLLRLLNVHSNDYIHDSITVIYCITTCIIYRNPGKDHRRPFMEFLLISHSLLFHSSL